MRYSDFSKRFNVDAGAVPNDFMESFTTEVTETTEENQDRLAFLCGLRVLCGKPSESAGARIHVEAGFG